MRKLGRIVICMLLFAAVFAGIGSSTEAAANLQWQTEAVYYDDSGRIIIEGYFYNNGSVTVTWVNWFSAKVYFRNADSSWWLAAGANFYDFNLLLFPGESKRWTFRIYNVNYYHFDQWRVNWNVNYNTQ